jgi:predicted PurR-regulated permease PerM
LSQTAVVTPSDPGEVDSTRIAVRSLTGILVLLVVAFCFFASSICITIMLSAFLAILVEPLVKWLERIHVPRFFGASLIILAGVAVIGFLIYVSYGKLTAFTDEFPLYVTRISDAVSPISKKIQKVQDSAGKLEQDASPKKVPEVRVRENTSWASYLARGVGSVWGAVIIAGVVPFLMYFMLLAHERIYFCFKTMAGKRVDLDQFVSRVSAMVRGYVVGNLIIGVLLSAISVVVFWQIGLPSAVTLGIVSGMLNLIPFVGIMLALVIPMMAGVFQLDGAGPYVIIGVTVILLHVVGQNLLIPRLVGSRLDIGPVAATVGFLFWGWLWGVPGLLLAVPLTAFVKLLADSNPSMAHLSNLLAREPQQFILRRRRKAIPQTSASTNPS